MKKRQQCGSVSGTDEVVATKELIRTVFPHPYRTKRGKQVRFAFVDFGNGRALRIYTRAFRSFGARDVGQKSLQNITFLVEYYATCRIRSDAYGERDIAPCRQWEVIAAPDLPEIFGLAPLPRSRQLHRMTFATLVQEMKRISRLRQIGGAPAAPGKPYVQTIFARFGGLADTGCTRRRNGPASPERTDTYLAGWHNRNIPKPQRG
ncbi:MAG: hypothetical protein RBT70_03615 [Alphaproteobacteria bacterium]|nr:hypothetical protein [Alphaproteobacteria bacterium]